MRCGCGSELCVLVGDEGVIPSGDVSLIQMEMSTGVSIM